MKKPHNNRIPNCLRKYRKARDLKQTEVSYIMRVKNTSIISRWENGVCLPSTLNVFKLSILYRVPEFALFIDLIRRLREEIFQREEEVLRMKHA